MTLRALAARLQGQPATGASRPFGVCMRPLALLPFCAAGDVAAAMLPLSVTPCGGRLWGEDGTAGDMQCGRALCSEGGQQ